MIEGTVDGLSPGLHGLAIHETGDTSEGCHSLGGHYNPRGARHGSPYNTSEERHYGDLGNIRAGEDGRARFRLVDKMVEVWEVIGRAGLDIPPCYLARLSLSMQVPPPPW